MSFTEKIDVLDLLIATIQEHEKKLDYLIHSLEPKTQPRDLEITLSLTLYQMEV